MRMAGCRVHAELPQEMGPLWKSGADHKFLQYLEYYSKEWQAFEKFQEGQ